MKPHLVWIDPNELPIEASLYPKIPKVDQFPSYIGMSIYDEYLKHPLCPLIKE